MGSQFVDLNGDGHSDYVTSIFDGSPHVSWGSEAGFGEPELLYDGSKERILVSYYWDYDEESHLTTGRSMPNGEAANIRGISALAFDWDADGDFDLLQGTYEEGRLFLQLNEGTNAAPRFTGKNRAVLAGGVPLENKAKMTAPRLVDWDGDGDQDLVYGTFGDAQTPGRILLLVNTGKVGAPVFAAPRVLLEGVAPEGVPEATGPSEGLYPEVVDWDGDGDLDLIVGGYSRWTPPSRDLTSEEQAKVVALREKLEVQQAAYQVVLEEYNAELETLPEGLTEEERSAAFEAVYGRFKSRLSDANGEVAAVRKQLEELVPAAKRKPFVWLYERL
jgi:hypothetical protein